MEKRLTRYGRAALMLALWPAFLNAQSSPALRDRHVEARVVGETSHLQPGRPYRLGLLLRHDEGWHTYWKSTATGYATSVDWDLPTGFTISELSWPTPKTYNFQGFTEYVHEGEVLLMATLTVPEDLDAGQVEIGFTAEWLMCEEICIPGEIQSMLVLPVRREAAAPSEWAGLFRETERALPAVTFPYRLSAWSEGRSVVLEVRGSGLPEHPYFFDDQAVFKPLASPVILRNTGEVLQLKLELDESVETMRERISGVLAAREGWPAMDGRPSLAVDLAIAPAPPVPERTESSLGSGILLLAFLGGLILNLMPCVFPVLGIKIMGFVSQAGEARGKIIFHGLTFSGGVLVSFWVLAGVLLALRSGGNQLGWGFQLQSPGFVLALTLLLFAFALNMSGLFEVGQSAVGVGSGLTGKSGLAGSFFSGVLATVVATPCAAPFLAPALGAALALPAMASLAVFTAIGLGLATPYMLLSAFPGMIRLLPRPGAWMETFKQAMSFLLYASVAYLLWVLAGQLGESGDYSGFAFLKVTGSLVILALGLWIYGRWGAFHRRRRSRVTGILVALLLCGGAVWTGFSGTRPVSSQAAAIEWEAWAPGKASEYAGNGKVVYVDFTARWCVTCQTNKAAVFSSGRVQDKLKELDVVLLKADWTNQDPRISAALASHGRSAVPFNLVYGPKALSPIALPEILTPGIVLKALETAAGAD
ncbi:MAG: protein-disulfide reductase DsbD family protein [Oceanipulchritudo sp.]